MFPFLVTDYAPLLSMYLHQIEYIHIFRNCRFYNWFYWLCWCSQRKYSFVILGKILNNLDVLQFTYCIMMLVSTRNVYLLIEFATSKDFCYQNLLIRLSYHSYVFWSAYCQATVIKSCTDSIVHHDRGVLMCSFVIIHSMRYFWLFSYSLRLLAVYC